MISTSYAKKIKKIWKTVRDSKIMKNGPILDSPDMKLYSNLLERKVGFIIFGQNFRNSVIVRMLYVHLNIL